MTIFSAPNDIRVFQNRLVPETLEYSLEESEQTPIFQQPIELYKIWASMIPDNPQDSIPLTSHFRPTMVPPAILPSMFVLTVLDDGMDFRWRLFGTEHVLNYGTDPTGMRASSVAKVDDTTKMVMELAQRSCKDRHPIFYLTSYKHGEDVQKTTSTVLLPMADKKGMVNRLMGCSIWQNKKPAASFQTVANAPKPSTV